MALGEDDPNFQVNNPLQAFQTTPTPPTKPTSAQVYDTKKTMVTFLVVSIVSLFIIPYMAYGSLSMASLGLFYSFKNASGWGRRVGYIFTILISIASLVLKAMISRH